jgi:hypothetical protein
MESVTFNRQTTQPPAYLAGRRFVPLGSSGSDAPTLTTPTRRDLFVWIYFKKSTRYHLSTNYGITKPQNYPTTAFVWHVFKKSAQIAHNFSHQPLDRSIRRIIVCNFFLKSTRFSLSPSPIHHSLFTMNHSPFSILYSLLSVLYSPFSKIRDNCL